MIPKPTLRGLLVFLLVATVAVAQETGSNSAPGKRIITCNGVLRDAAGTPRLGTVGLTLSLYAAQEGGEPLWRESQTIQTDEQGRYTILIGATEEEGLPLQAFGSREAQWLGVQPEGEEEQPRILLLAVPYALKAADADTVGGKPLSSFVLYEDLDKAVARSVPAAPIILQNALPGIISGSTTTASSTARIGVRTSQFSSGITPAASNETGTNTWYGEGAGASITAGANNSFFGQYAGSLTDGTPGLGSDNSFFGWGAGRYNTTGDSNSFFGSNAGLNNATGTTNSFFGDDAGRYNSTGSSNSFFGDDAGQENTTGVDNSFFGARAGGENTTGGHNSFFGYGAGEGNTSGSENAFFGDHAGYFSAGGHSNSFLGAYSDGASGITNSTAIGYRAQVTQSNSLVLGSINGVNGATADTNVGIGVSAPSRLLEVRKDQNGSTYLQVTNMNDAVDVSRSRFALVAGGVTQEMQSIARDGGYFGTTSNHPFRIYTNKNTRVTIDAGGNVGINTLAPTERLHVVGNIRFTGTLVNSAPEEDIPDYVFERDYPLMPLAQLAQYVEREKHLPNVPTAAEVRENGLNLVKLQARMLEKIEELTLYAVQQAQQNEEQQAALGKKDREIAMLMARLAVLEKTVERVSLRPIPGKGN